MAIERCTELPSCRHPKYEIGSVINHEVWTIMSTKDMTLAEIHLGRWTPGKYSVRFAIGPLDTFIMESFDKVQEVDTIKEAAAMVDCFLHCGAVEHFLVEGE